MQRLDFLLTRGREIIKEHLPVNSCVSSTRIAVEFLGARALPVYVMVTTSQTSALVGRGRKPIEGWNGHLIADTGDLLVDLTLDQAGLYPIALPHNDLSTGIPEAYMVDDALVLYWLDMCPTPYENTEAWNESWKIPFERIVDEYYE